MRLELGLRCPSLKRECCKSFNCQLSPGILLTVICRLALRINVLAKGHSGISRQNVEKLLAALNKNVLSVVPSKGTVGASGDLAPLAHLVLGMLGDGMMWDPEDQSQKPAAEVMKKYNLEYLELGPKEGLALINGTQLITCLGCVGNSLPNIIC